MKKSIIIAAILGAALSVSCNREEIPDINSGMQTVTISASINPATKTSYAGGTAFSWTAGDKISVLCSDGNFYEFTASSTAASSAFTGMIPAGESVSSYAFFPADANHASAGGGSYKFSIPEYKDLTSHPSADMPMVGDKGEGNSYSFMHCSGAALLTVTDIPAKYTSVEVSIVNASLKISGLYGVYKSSGVWTYGAAAGSTDSEKTFVRKVVVNDGAAQVYLPYASGADIWAKSVVKVTGYDSSNTPTVLFSDKQMKALPAFTRAEVLPLAPLVVPPTNNLKNIDWSDPTIVANAGLNSRIVEWKASSDKAYIYINYKITTSKISSTKYIYIGLDYTAGGGEVGGGVTGSDWDVKALVYPFEETGFKDGEDPSSYIQFPIGTSTGIKITTTGYDYDSTYSYVSVSIPRSAIGSPASGLTLNIQSAMDWYPTGTGSITLQ